MAATPATPAADLPAVSASTPSPDTRILDTAIAVLSGNGKVKKRKGRKDGKPKAMSAKAEAQGRAGVKVTDDEADQMQAARNARSRVSRAASRAATKAKAKQ